MNKLALAALLAAVAAPSAVLTACSTDNGANVYGNTYGPPPTRPDGGEGGDLPEQDGAIPLDRDAGKDDDASSPPTCASGTIAVLAGGDAALTGATQDKGGAWVAAAVGASAAKSSPELVAFGAGFLGVTRGPGDALQSVSYGGAWSASAIGAATTIGAPALAVIGTTAHVVFLDGTNKFFHGTYTGGAWDGADDPVTPSGGTQSFGSTPATIAPAAASLAFAQDGTNEGLYVQSWSSGAWAAAEAVTGAGTFQAQVPPALVAVDGASDLVLLFADNSANHVIRYTTHPKASAITAGWAAPKDTNSLALTSDPFRAARISPTTIAVTYRGGDGRPYAMLGTIGASDVTWSAPAPLLADTTTVDSSPAVAAGVCGDDAVAVYASGGAVSLVRLRGSTWSAPEAVTGAAGTRVAIATRP